MSDHPTHSHQLPGGGVPHEASFVGTPGGPGRTRSRGAGSCFAPREAGFAGTPVHPAKQASRGPPVVAVCPATLGLTGDPTRPASWGPLTSAPQAFTLSVPLTASTSRFLAAFTSRSMTRPHPSQVKTRSARDSLAFTIPQAEQVLELGKNRSATMSRPPCQLVL